MISFLLSPQEEGGGIALFAKLVHYTRAML